MTTTLRYIGDYPTAFAEFRIGQVEPGDTFGVPNDQAPAYTARADIEVVGVEPDETDEPDIPEDPDDVPQPDPAVPAEPDPAPAPVEPEPDVSDDPADQ
jgi:hypothetical protein